MWQLWRVAGSIKNILWLGKCKKKKKKNTTKHCFPLQNQSQDVYNQEMKAVKYSVLIRVWSRYISRTSTRTCTHPSVCMYAWTRDEEPVFCVDRWSSEIISYERPTQFPRRTRMTSACTQRWAEDAHEISARRTPNPHVVWSVSSSKSNAARFKVILLLYFQWMEIVPH